MKYRSTSVGNVRIISDKLLGQSGSYDTEKPQTTEAVKRIFPAGYSYLSLKGTNNLNIDNVTYYDKVSLRMSFIGYQAPNVGHIL